MKYVTVYSLSVIGLLIILFGCNGEDAPTPPQPSGYQIMIHAGEDTLHYLPGDSASTRVSILVLDRDGHGVPGQVVHISLSGPNCCGIEFCDPLLRDTTNAFGWMDVIFFEYGCAGSFRITATVADVTAFTIIVAPAGDYMPGELSVVVVDDTLHYLSTDSTEVRVRLSDSGYDPVVGVIIPLIISAGRIGGSVITDSTGAGSTWYWPPHETGSYVIRAYYQSLMDSAMVYVEP